MKDYRYKGYWFKWIPVQESYSIQKDGFHIGWAADIKKGKEVIDLLTDGENPCGSASRSKGKRNPSLVVYDNPGMKVRVLNDGRVVGVIGERVYQVRYRHAEDGEDYYHDFAKGVKLIALDNGDVLLTSDKPLWEDFA